MFENIDLCQIKDENTSELVARLLYLVEKLSLDLRDAQSEIQRLRDEVNRLKGEQGLPKIKEYAQAAAKRSLFGKRTAQATATP